MYPYKTCGPVALLCLTLLANAAAQTAPSIAVVGAGVGGAFTATRIGEMSHPPLQPDIDIFEAETQEGGRIRQFNYKGEPLELGASIFWEHNRYIKTAVERLGLRLRRLNGKKEPNGGRTAAGGSGVSGIGGRQGGQPAEDEDAHGFAVWNGTAFVVNMTGSWSDTLHAGLRYGTAALRYKWLVSDAFRRFQRVYDMQAAGTTWDTPEALLRDLDLFNETQQRCSDYMKDWLQQPLWWLWGGAEFADEVAGAANRCNYNQNNEQMNTLAGLVSYMPAAYGAVYQIEGGNRQVVSGLLAASGAQLVAAARVTMVRRRREDGRYFLEVRRSSGGRQQAAACDGATNKTKKEEDMKDTVNDATKTVTAPAAVAATATAEAAVATEEADQEEIIKEVADFANEVFGPYDAVVIATPLLGSGIHFDLDGDGDVDVDGGGKEAVGSRCEDPAAKTSSGAPETVLHQPYQVTVTTYVAAGGLRAGYFNVVRVPPVEQLFVTSGALVPFSSIAMKRLGQSKDLGGGGNGSDDGDGGSQRVYKIFSREELPQQLLSELFESDSDSPRVLYSRRWYAYPRFRPPERFSPFVLAPGLLYGNALEPAASAMEMAAIAAHNSAALVVRHLKEMGAAAAEAVAATLAPQAKYQEQ